MEVWYALWLFLCFMMPVSYAVARVRYVIQHRSKPVEYYPGINGNPSSSVEWARMQIPQDIRDEIDQTLGWWDREYHRLLAKVDEPIVHEVEYEQTTFLGGGSVLTPTRVRQEFMGCPCDECKYARRYYR